MGKRAVGLGLALLAGGMSLAACGGDEKRLTAAELTTKGNAVCAKLDADVKKLADTLPVSISFTPDQMQTFYTKILPLLDRAVAGFKKLEPPKDLEDAYDSALDQIQIDRRTLAGATNSPEAAKNLFDTGVDPFTATDQKLRAAGITGCGEEPAPGAGGDGGAATTTTTAAVTTTTASK